MSVKISAFEIENVKRVKAVAYEPTENGLTVLGGKWSYNIPLERLIDYATKCNAIIAKGV